MECAQVPDVAASFEWDVVGGEMSQLSFGRQLGAGAHLQGLV